VLRVGRVYLWRYHRDLWNWGCGKGRIETVALKAAVFVGDEGGGDSSAAS
jgi:hypothetical protein